MAKSMKMVDTGYDDMKQGIEPQDDGFLPDFTAKRDHIIVQNDERYEFKGGKKASETNQIKIPSRFRATLETEAVI